jgi:hypothetical protein
MTNTFTKLRVFLVASAMLVSFNAFAFDWGGDPSQSTAVGTFAADSSADEQLVSPDVHSCPNCNKDQSPRRGLRGPRGIVNGNGAQGAEGVE